MKENIIIKDMTMPELAARQPNLTDIECQNLRKEVSYRHAFPSKNLITKKEKYNQGITWLRKGNEFKVGGLLLKKLVEYFYSYSFLDSI